jgi:hypothetical protein
LACFDCNRLKGTNIASLDPFTGELVALFNPRTQKWTEHFQLNGIRIVPLTATGRATERLLQMNIRRRLKLRERWAKWGFFP